VIAASDLSRGFPANGVSLRWSVRRAGT